MHRDKLPQASTRAEHHQTAKLPTIVLVHKGHRYKLKETSNTNGITQPSSSSGKSTRQRELIQEVLDGKRDINRVWKRARTEEGESDNFGRESSPKSPKRRKVIRVDSRTLPRDGPVRRSARLTNQETSGRGVVSRASPAREVRHQGTVTGGEGESSSQKAAVHHHNDDSVFHSRATLVQSPPEPIQAPPPLPPNPLPHPAQTPPADHGVAAPRNQHAYQSRPNDNTKSIIAPTGQGRVFFPPPPRSSRAPLPQARSSPQTQHQHQVRPLQPPAEIFSRPLRPIEESSPILPTSQPTNMTHTKKRYTRLFDVAEDCPESPVHSQSPRHQTQMQTKARNQIADHPSGHAPRSISPSIIEDLNADIDLKVGRLERVERCEAEIDRLLSFTKELFVNSSKDYVVLKKTRREMEEFIERLKTSAQGDGGYGRS